MFNKYKNILMMIKEIIEIIKGYNHRLDLMNEVLKAIGESLKAQDGFNHSTAKHIRVNINTIDDLDKKLRLLLEDK